VVPIFHSSRLHNFLQFEKKKQSAGGFLRQLKKEKVGVLVGVWMGGWGKDLPMEEE
jgi:hypothetical protein